MKRITEKKRQTGINWVDFLKLAFLLSLIVLGACKREEPMTVLEMPTTPVLTVRANWGVVMSPYLRIRRQPRMDGDVVAHLRNSSIAEILAKTTYPEIVEGQTNYWYEISSDGLRGWVFGSYLEFFDSRSKAELAARTSTNG
jgi:hypothetical protein